jgi:two-component system, chemotaxis family, CheB/CheR fusion protein
VLIPEGQRDELATILERIRAGHRVEQYETLRQTKDGRLVEASLTVSPISDASGVVVGASTIARDITARERTDVALRTSELRWAVDYRCGRRWHHRD